MSETYDPKRARTKRPLPMWVDAFVRDTLELEADEIGAYHLILYAMWTRVSCDFPDDDRKLARVARVSTRLWKGRVGAVLRPFFQVENGMLISKRLRKEATYAERQGKQQSDRKSGENADKVLKDNNMVPTTGIPTETTGDQPTQLPNYPNKKEGDKSPSCAISRFDEFWDCFPHRGGVKRNRKTCEPRYRRAVSEGVDEERLISAAVAYGALCKSIEKLPRDPATWLNQEGWSDETAEPVRQPTDDEIRARMIENIKSGMPFRCRTIAASDAAALVRSGAVTREQCSQVEIRI